MNLQRREVKLVQIVTRFLVDRSGKLLLLLSKISFGSSHPPCDNMVSGSVAIPGRNSIKRFPREIEVPKPQGGGSKIELTIWVFWTQVCNSFTQRDRLFEILLFCCFG